MCATDFLHKNTPSHFGKKTFENFSPKNYQMAVFWKHPVVCQKLKDIREVDSDVGKIAKMRTCKIFSFKWFGLTKIFESIKIKFRTLGIEPSLSKMIFAPLAPALSF
jgi:hypothetical protein